MMRSLCKGSLKVRNKSDYLRFFYGDFSWSYEVAKEAKVIFLPSLENK